MAARFAGFFNGLFCAGLYINALDGRFLDKKKRGTTEDDVPLVTVLGQKN